MPLVGNEPRNRYGRAARAGRVRDVSGHRLDRGRVELPAEARHPVAAAPDLAKNGRVVRPELVEVWADLAVRTRIAKRVAACASGGGEESCTASARLRDCSRML